MTSEKAIAFYDRKLAFCVENKNVITHETIVNMVRRFCSVIIRWLKRSRTERINCYNYYFVR